MYKEMNTIDYTKKTKLRFIFDVNTRFVEMPTSENIRANHNMLINLVYTQAFQLENVAINVSTKWCMYYVTK